MMKSLVSVFPMKRLILSFFKLPDYGLRLVYTFPVALHMSCASLQTEHDDGFPQQSQLTSLTISAYEPPPGGKPWAATKLLVEQISPGSTTVNKSYERAAFESDQIEARSFRIAYGTYRFRLEYPDEASRLVYRSCPDEDSRQHQILTAQDRLTIKICQIDADDAMEPSRPIGEVTLTPTAEANAGPLPGKVADQPSQQSEPDPSQQGNGFWVDPNSSARRDAASFKPAESPDGRRLRYIAAQPAAIWYTQWRDDMTEIVAGHVAAAQAANAILVIVPYLIPLRDCGQYSAGGVDPERYRVWIERLATGLANARVFIILEPDALAMIEDLKDDKPCLTAEEKATRLSLMRQATLRFKRNPNARVYLDGGHPAWKSADFMVDILTRAGIDVADGFALNVSSYQTTESNVVYGTEISSRLGKKTFVIDTSRNGKGPTSDNEWCNPAGRALGMPPTMRTNRDRVDALLWIKRPGESDGTCNGGPAAGAWWREMALQLAKNAGIE